MPLRPQSTVIKRNSFLPLRVSACVMAGARGRVRPWQGGIHQDRSLRSLRQRDAHDHAVVGVERRNHAASVRLDDVAAYLKAKTEPAFARREQGFEDATERGLVDARAVVDHGDLDGSH